MVEARGSEKCSCKKIVIDRDTTECKYKKIGKALMVTAYIIPLKNSL
jgi:hypothetical protein